MPIKIARVECSPISLPEYIEHIEATIDFRDNESIIASAPALQRLAANKYFLGDWLVDALLNRAQEFQQGNAYNYQSMVIRVTDNYLLRVNFWVPQHQLSKLSDREAMAFGYDAYHNHNFNLLTVGYTGSGYDTDLYRMREPYRPYELGDVPALDPLGRWHLGCEEVMFYEAFADVHAQVAPPDLSVSINLMTHSTRNTWPQFMFDSRSRAISAIVGSPLDARIHLLTMARSLVPERANQALARLANSDPSPRLQKLAKDAIAGRFTDWR
ncbi:hypothetical protein [Dokdonella soli]|uniref:HEAT repeat domain-containing protein n=1 Tax=Dokdonella soli TaxID=529810 RepID=A0ABN1IFB3_9GAMM